MVVPIVSQHPVFRHQLGDGNRKARRRDGGDEVKNLVGVGKIRVARSPNRLLIGILNNILTTLTVIVPIIRIMAPCTNPCFSLVLFNCPPTFLKMHRLVFHNLPHSAAGFQFLFCKSFLKRRCSFPFEYMPCAFQSCAAPTLQQQKDRLSAGPRMHPFDSYSFSSIRGFSS